MALTRVELENFTAFKSLKLDLCPGVNVLVGANGTGKTHLMKVCYAACDVAGTPVDDFTRKLVAVFMPSGWELQRLVRRGRDPTGEAMICVERGGLSLQARFSKGSANVSNPRTWADNPVSATYIPVKEMLANAPGFRSLHARHRIHFEEVYKDILDLAYTPARRQLDALSEDMLATLQAIVGGAVVVRDEEFVVRHRHGDLEFPLLAEGARKLGLLWVLIRNGTLQRGSIMFWDEPEANLNPKLFGVVIDVLLKLQRAGVQIFLATHDYVILKELDLRATAADKLAFHSLYQKDGTDDVGCATTYNYLEIDPNAIADTFTDLYDREVARSLTGASK